MLGVLVILAPLLTIPIAAAVLHLLWRSVRAGRVGSTPVAQLTVILVAAVACAVLAPEAIVQAAGLRGAGARLHTLGLALGGVLSLALLAFALIGDRARGRRRCPACWYDMGGTTGAVCPECGHDAGTEARLSMARRRRGLVALSVVPFLVAGSLYVRWFADQSDWYERLPTPVLTAVSPFVINSSVLYRVPGELIARMAPYSIGAERTCNERERRLQALVSHAVCRWHPRRTAHGTATVMFHAGLLEHLDADDERTTDLLIELTGHTDAAVVREACVLLGRMDHGLDRAEAALTGLIGTLEKSEMQRAVFGLYQLKGKRRGGPVPERVLAIARDEMTVANQDLAYTCVLLLGRCERDDRIRDVLIMASIDTPGTACHEPAIEILCRGYLDDPRVREMLARHVPRGRMSTRHVQVISEGDDRVRLANGELPPERLALYTEELRGLLVGVVEGRLMYAGGEAVGNAQWLIDHPAFTPEERDRVRTKLEAATGPRSTKPGSTKPPAPRP